VLVVPEALLFLESAHTLSPALPRQLAGGTA
jgi:hypothetical protein